MSDPTYVIRNRRTSSTCPLLMRTMMGIISTLHRLCVVCSLFRCWGLPWRRRVGLSRCWWSPLSRWSRGGGACWWWEGDTTTTTITTTTTTNTSSYLVVRRWGPRWLVAITLSKPSEVSSRPRTPEPSPVAALLMITSTWKQYCWLRSAFSYTLSL